MSSAPDGLSLPFFYTSVLNLSFPLVKIRRQCKAQGARVFSCQAATQRLRLWREPGSCSCGGAGDTPRVVLEWDLGCWCQGGQ